MRLSVNPMTGMPVLSPRPDVSVVRAGGGAPTSSGDGNGESWTTDVAAEPADGTRTQFMVSNAYIADQIIVYLNGLRDIHFTQTASNKVTFDTAPLTGDEITFFYRTI